MPQHYGGRRRVLFVFCEVERVRFCCGERNPVVVEECACAR